MQSMFFEVGAFDGMTFGLVTLGVAVVSVIAMLVPALRASQDGPMVAMRAGGGSGQAVGRPAGRVRAAEWDEL